MPDYKMGNGRVLRDSQGTEIGQVGYDGVVQSGGSERGRVDNSGGYTDEYGRHMGWVRSGDSGSVSGSSAGGLGMGLFAVVTLGVFFLLDNGWRGLKEGNPQKTAVSWGSLILLIVGIPVWILSTGDSIFNLALVFVWGAAVIGLTVLIVVGLPWMIIKKIGEGLAVLVRPTTPPVAPAPPSPDAPPQPGGTSAVPVIPPADRLTTPTMPAPVPQTTNARSAAPAGATPPVPAIDVAQALALGVPAKDEEDLSKRRQGELKRRAGKVDRIWLQMHKKFCLECGARNELWERYCRACGKELDMLAPLPVALRAGEPEVDLYHPVNSRIGSPAPDARSLAMVRQMELDRRGENESAGGAQQHPLVPGVWWNLARRSALLPSLRRRFGPGIISGGPSDCSASFLMAEYVGLRRWPGARPFARHADLGVVSRAE